MTNNLKSEALGAHKRFVEQCKHKNQEVLYARPDQPRVRTGLVHYLRKKDCKARDYKGNEVILKRGDRIGAVVVFIRGNQLWLGWSFRRRIGPKPPEKATFETFDRYVFTHRAIHRAVNLSDLIARASFWHDLGDSECRAKCQVESILIRSDDCRRVPRSLRKLWIATAQEAIDFLGKQLTPKAHAETTTEATLA